MYSECTSVAPFLRKFVVLLLSIFLRAKAQTLCLFETQHSQELQNFKLHILSPYTV